jgi:hypothetical protein
VQVGLHHHREQRLIDPPAPFQQRGKNDPARNLGIRSSKSPAVVQQPGPVSVALGQSGIGALMWGGAKHVRELGFDQGLVDGLGGLTDAVIDLRGRECVQDLQLELTRLGGHPR